MRVFIAGIDGYLGWSLAQYLAARGHSVGGCDNYLRRGCVAEMGSASAVPIAGMEERAEAFAGAFGVELFFREGTLLDRSFVEKCFIDFRPDAVVHFAQIPSAPYSMIDAEHAFLTQENNVLGNLNVVFAIRNICPEAHLLKLGTMGEYGTPDMDIPEGFFEVEYRGRKDRMFFPRCPGSIYHLTKVHDSHNVWFACRTWGIKATDIMQGVVFGTRIEEMPEGPAFRTRFDFDQCFGTAINRFCVQAAIEAPVTPYGAGGQKRGFLPLEDSMQCLTIALENPPGRGEYRVFNQFEETYVLSELAAIVSEEAEKLGLRAPVRRIENPRIELEEHYYNPDHEKLPELGYRPTTGIRAGIRRTIGDLLPFRDRIRNAAGVLAPSVCWDGARRKLRYID